MKRDTISNYEPIQEGLVFSRKRTVGDAGYAYHRHDACEILLFLEGDIRFYIEQTCFVPAPGSLVILNPNEMHRVQSVGDTPYERIVLNVKKSFMDMLSTEDYQLADCFYRRPSGTGNLRILSADQVTEFLDMYGRLERSSTEEAGSSVERNAYTSLLLLWISRRYQDGRERVQNMMPAYVSGVMKYIADHLDEPLSLEKLAKMFHVSPGYLSTQFRRHTGLTLRDYLLDRKVNHAKMLMLEGANVSEACYQAGFGDYSNFIRSFKKVTGMPPGKFRRS